MSCPPKAEGLDPIELRDELFEIWSMKDPEKLHLAAFQGFSKLSEPLEALLTIVETCPAKQKGRSHTLGHHILTKFQAWMEQHPQVTLSSLPEQQAGALQMQALRLLTDINSSFLDCLIKIYQLDSLHPVLLRAHVLTLQARNCYKEAVAVSVKLQLQQELDMEEICVPLILQNKMQLAETFVTGHSLLEEKLVTLLDSWCHPSFNVNNISRRYPHLPLSKHCTDQLQPKLLTKQVFRLMEKFNINQELCPNALFKRRRDALSFLVNKRFVGKSMSEENWSDHVQKVVADNLELQLALVQMLVKKSGLQEASQWSLRYQLPRNRLPYGVWEAQQSLPPHLQQVCLGDSADAEEWTPAEPHCQKFYQVPLSRDKVHFVDTLEALQSCRSVLLKEGGVVGIDMEWQPSFGFSSSQQVALIQLAVADQVFLLDLCRNGFCQHPDTAGFIRSLFSDRNVLKLGYGMSGDLKCLLATWQQFLEEPLKMERMLDLLNIHQKIQRVKVRSPQSAPREVLVGEESPEKGLSLMVQQVLGRPLDKTEQMSNWEKRPLRLSQIRYAVADACCLLDVFSALSSDPARYGLPADLCSVSADQPQKDGEKKQKEKAAKQKKQSQSSEECQGARGVSPPRSDPEKGLLCGEEPPSDAPPLPPQQLRVVCDNMLQGLGRYLRCLGVDVVMLGNTDDHRVAAKLAQAERRVILTCGQPFQSLRSQVGEGRCLSLDCSEKARDQAVRVLRHFNVRPTASDIFSRCQACNSDQYATVPRKDMVRMLKQKGFLPEQDDGEEQQDEEATPRVTSGLPRYAPQCQWASLSGLDPDTLTFPGGEPMQLHTVPPGLLPKIPFFYVCTRCGKVFWEGSHFDRVVSQFQDVLHLADGESAAAAPHTAAQQN